jgi:hypothetical protein
MPAWIVKLAQRLMALEPGRWQIILTIDKDRQDWTVIQLGKVEKP